MIETTVDRTRTTLVRAMRVAATGEVLALLLQAASAGQLLSGVVSARALHGVGAIPVHVFAAAELVVAVLLWRRGGPVWPAWASGALLLATFGQAALGSSGAVAVHVPLGIALVVLATVLLAQSWRRPATACV
jgi:hypothetical protein